MSKAEEYAARNRENQRRSRARRKDYITELEQRIRSLEREGVMATMEMQVAARKVADENQLLRNLLGKHGVSEVEIETYLKIGLLGASGRGDWQFSQQNSPESNAEYDSTEISSKNGRAGRREPSEYPDTQPIRQTSTSFTSQVNSKSIARLETISARQPRHNNQPSCKPASPDISEESSLTKNGFNSATILSSPSRSTPSLAVLQREQSSPLLSSTISTPLQHVSPGSSLTCGESSSEPLEGTTPCEEAAMIIASMRGHSDPESIWDELGCSSTNRCMVKNTTIFQLV